MCLVWALTFMLVCRISLYLQNYSLYNHSFCSVIVFLNTALFNYHTRLYISQIAFPCRANHCKWYFKDPWGGVVTTWNVTVLNSSQWLCALLHFKDIYCRTFEELGACVLNVCHLTIISRKKLFWFSLSLM